MRVSILGEVSHYDPSVNLKLSCALSIVCFMQLRFPSKTKEFLLKSIFFLINHFKDGC